MPKTMGVATPRTLVNGELRSSYRIDSTPVSRGVYRVNPPDPVPAQIVPPAPELTASTGGLPVSDERLLGKYRFQRLSFSTETPGDPLATQIDPLSARARLENE